MKYNPTRLLFLLTLGFGTMIVISSSSWLGAWAGLEINLLSFIPLMTNKDNQFSTEAALKYFLVQALASAVLLLSVILMFLSTQASFNTILCPFNFNLLISSSLLLKMGAAPFHFWFPGVMEGLNWENNLILMTWQKIAPLMLISYLFSAGVFSSFVILISVLVGSLGGFNQTSLRKIMAYSSINHLGWMLSATLLGDNYWLVYFCFYSFLSVSIVLIFMNYQLSHITQVFSSPINSNLLKLLMFTNLLSLGGLPPFLGFLPKWIIIQEMVNQGAIFIISVMVILTLITLYFYLRIGYSAFMLTHSETKWNSFFHFNSPIKLLILFSSSLSLGGLLICSALTHML